MAKDKKYFVSFGIRAINENLGWVIAYMECTRNSHGDYKTSNGMYSRAFDTETDAINSNRELKTGCYFKRVGY